ncbi:guanylate-binding protein 3-like [Stegostoma tigrinum]|uniref:guanylate-binding protein 3-like n=1 Tax=Stegostoma tigrinum TaxID=3053191 RepID=UPI00287039AB|nr:guanylate-binding protein 3-like [Stegostoma tigrinum]
MESYTEMESPIALVVNSPDGSLSVHQPAVDLLKTIDQALVVVAIIGKYRTGKSYLLNRLAGKQKGFEIGGSVQSETKGIWMWALPHPRMEDCCLLLLDTEGLGDVEKGNVNNDNKIFALAVLLSSMFVYNSKGTIDQQALQDINYVTELTKIIRSKSGEKDDHGEEFMQYFPGFVWVVRDFCLELKINKKEVTADEYLENALKLKEGEGPDIENFNLPRRCIRYYFPSRNCFVFDTPGNKRVLRNIETVDDKELEEDFVQISNKFCEFIYTMAMKKTVPGFGSKVFTGTMFAQLLTAYTDLFRRGELACLDQVVQSLTDTENEKAVKEAEKLFEEQMEKLVTLPTETAEELNDIYTKCNKEAFDMFLKRALGNSERYRDKLQGAIDATFDDYCKRNGAESSKKCRGLLKELFQEIDVNFAANVYLLPGGYSEYLKDRTIAINRYNQTPQKGVKATDVLEEFLKQRKSESENIRMMDEDLTNRERKVEVEKERQSLAELQKAAMEQQTKMMKSILEAVAQNNNNNLTKFMEMLRQERELQMKQQEQITRKQQEIENMSNKTSCVIQ